MDHETVVTLPADGEVEVRFTPRKGGRLRGVVTAATDPGPRIEARCEVLRPDGTSTGVAFEASEDVGRHRRWASIIISSASNGQVRIIGGGERSDLLPPGAYLLKVTADGHLPRRVPVTVLAGETVTVETSLDPE